MLSSPCSLLRRAARIAGLSAATVSLVILGVFGVGPHTGRYRTLTVLSGSMRPAVPAGSVVLVTPLLPKNIRLGDVITYSIPVEDRRVVSHRVVEIVEPGDHPVLRTQGDANATPDPWLARLETEPAWRVRAVVPQLGSVLHALRVSPLRPVLLWGAPALLSVIWLIQIHRRDRRRHDEAVAAFGVPDPHVVLVVPPTRSVNRDAEDAEAPDTEGRPGEEPRPAGRLGWEPQAVNGSPPRWARTVALAFALALLLPSPALGTFTGPVSASPGLSSATLEPISNLAV